MFLMKIKIVPTFQPVSEDFFMKWEGILHNAGKNIVELFLHESAKVIARIEIFLTKFINAPR